MSVLKHRTQHHPQQLVEALNEDYSDYVGLSSQLSGLEGAVVRMRQPLLEIQVGVWHVLCGVLFVWCSGRRPQPQQQLAVNVCACVSMSTWSWPPPCCSLLLLCG